MPLRRGLLALLALFCVTPLAPAADWFHWRGPWQTGVSPDKDLPASWSPEGGKDSNLVWKAPYRSRSTPIVMNGRVYLINYAEDKGPETIQERVLCLDAQTGKKLWEYRFNVWHTDIVTVRLGWTNLAGDPATGNVYAHGTQGMLFCFDRDGKILWKHSLTEEYGRITGYGGRVTSPTVDQNLVIIGMLNSSWGDQKSGNRWVAFDKRNGKVVWWSQPGRQPKNTYYCVPVVAVIGGQRLLISGGADGGVHAMKVRTGEPVWSYYFGTTAVNSSPVVKGNLVYIGQGVENPDNNLQGRIICVDGSQVSKGQPKLVWQRDGIKARYASPILHDDKLYMPDDIGRLYCLDAKTGKDLWRRPFSYGRNTRGSPVLADGKIYVGEVTSRFYILKPGPKTCEVLHEQFFPSPDGVSDVEMNGSPAVAEGRVFFSTSEATYCIGKPGVKGQPWAKVEPATDHTDTPGHLQIFPAEVAVHPGASVTFKARLFDTKGNFLKEVPAEWTLPTPPAPKGAKSGPPALKGVIESGVLAVNAKVPAQQGYVRATFNGLTATARVRVAPVLPYSQDFTALPDGAVPGGWVNALGKYVVKTVNGEKVLAKVTDKASPLVARGSTYIGLPNLSDYTIEADVQGGKKGDDMPDVGVGANRYTLVLAGNIQKLRILSWDALPRIDSTVPFAWKPGTWYRLKLTVDVKGDTAVVRGKAWPRGEKEPEAWTVQVTDPRPNRNGSPTLYGYVLNNLNNTPGTDVYYDNVRITPNPK